MINHTQGEWHLLPARTLINVKGPNGEQICQIEKTQEANARLIAAAPKLLKACIRAAAVIPLGTGLLTELEDAIAAAKGE